jgi:hypothetical protein
MKPPFHGVWTTSIRRFTSFQKIAESRIRGTGGEDVTEFRF